MTRHLKLLFKVFTRDGKVCCSGVDTDEGRLIDWYRLEDQGLVKRNTKSGRGILGHNFSYRLTIKGNLELEQLCNPQPKETP